VAFLQKKYGQAIDDLERGLALAEDPYARDLLAASLHLAGRSDEALGVWNALGQPKLRSLEIRGLAHTRDRVARRELTLVEGDMLALGKLRESRLRLQELDVFERVTLRPTPLGDGTADLDVIVTEQHGIARSVAEFAVASVTYAARSTAHLRYANLAGTGASLAGDYRWQERRPELSFSADVPRPLGVPAVLHFRAFDGRQDYDLGGDVFRRKSRGLDLGLRRVLGPGTVGEATLRTRDRVVTPPRADAPSGRIVGLEAGFDQRLLETHRHRIDGAIRLFAAPLLLGSDLTYARSLTTLKYRVFLAPPEDVLFERSVLAAQLKWGRGGPEMPVDEMFAPGGNAEMDLPLRGRRQRSGGALGGAPIGRSLLLGNLEWRQRLVRGTFAQWGFVTFYDGAYVSQVASGPPRALHDVGLGLRLSLGGMVMVRADFGHGLTDGQNSFFVNFGQVF
jgi:outer membrane protein assembly factor BamA